MTVLMQDDRKNNGNEQNADGEAGSGNNLQPMRRDMVWKKWVVMSWKMRRSIEHFYLEEREMERIQRADNKRIGRNSLLGKNAGTNMVTGTNFIL